jgi:hypothetical protein
MAFTPPPQIPQRGARATFSGAVDAFLKWMAALPAQLETFLGNITSMAGGGAFAIPLTLVTNAEYVGGTTGRISLKPNGGAMKDAIEIVFDSVDTRGTALKGQMDDLFYNGNVSAIRGYVRLVKIGDPSKWITFRVTSWAYSGGQFPYGSLTVTCVGYSSPTPFVDGDSVLLFPERNGDKGDTGNADKKVQTAPAPVGGVVTVDYRNGNCLVWSPAAGSTATLNITNWPSNGNLGEFWIIGTNLGAATVNMSAPLNWLRPDGTYANTASINTNQGTTLRSSGEDNVLLWGHGGFPNVGKVAR